jgi:Na+-transporting NADH:ubiquinone oxidoreductase subunit NqrC
MSDNKKSFTNSRIYVVLFALTVALFFSVLITSAATLLKPRQLENMALDKRTNLLEAAGLVPGTKNRHRKTSNRSMTPISGKPMWTPGDRSWTPPQATAFSYT